ncbi:hypothetical protein SISNIDRAFT_401705, partial [Sistotremastrum niveocremeum HHB9708]
MRQIHPYTSAAWAVISAGFKVRAPLQQRDAAMSDLVDVMDDACALVSASASLELHTANPRRKIAAKLLHQATECGYFIQWYAKDKGLLKRTAQNLSGSAEPNIKRFIKSFERLRKAFQEHATAEIDIAVLRIVGKVEDIVAAVNLNDMPYAKGAGYALERGCLSETRTKIITEITDWLLRPIVVDTIRPSDSPDVRDDRASLFWLSGFAGSGKSAIAHTIAANLAAIGRLGSAFFFDEATANDRSAAVLFSHISRDLADTIPEWKQALAPIVEKASLRYSPSVTVQFDELILRPAQACTFVGPILLVIDALDERGGDGVSRRELLRILSSRLHELPVNFRVILTSRPDKEIEDALNSTPYVERRILDKAAANDLGVYFQSRLGDQPALDRRWPHDEWIRILVHKSEGLFQWAFTACEFMLERGWEVPERFETLLITTELEGIDSLYKAILRSRFGSDVNDIRIPRFQAVLGRALCVLSPLRVSDLITLRGPSEKPETTEAILKWMGSVLTGVTPGSQGRVQAFHTSFRDFLFNQHRSGIFHVDPPTHHLALARACLVVLNKELKFNICGLETSYNSSHPNADNFRDRIREHVSGALLYASEFWSHHVAEIAGEADPTLIELVQEFVNTKFLFWLELLGFTKKIYWAGGAMRTMVKWASMSHVKSLITFGADAQRFISNFAEVIGRSPAHLYISCLPFAPESSLVSQQYLPLFNNTIRAQSGKQPMWNPLQKPQVLHGHTAGVREVAFDHRGKHLVSCSNDSTIRVWDTVNWTSVKLRGHDSAVYSVQFYDYGNCIISGSRDKTLRIWNANNGEPVGNPLRLH